MHRRWLVSGMAALALAAAGGGVSARQLASRPVDDWSARLERPERIAGLKIDYIISSLGLKPGVVVADIGAGPGVLTVPLAPSNSTMARTCVSDAMSIPAKRIRAPADGGSREPRRRCSRPRLCMRGHDVVGPGIPSGL